MTISDAYERADSAARSAGKSAREYADRMMVLHLHVEHGMGAYKIAKLLSMRRPKIARIIAGQQRSLSNNDGEP